MAGVAIAAGGPVESRAWGVFEMTFNQVQFLLDHNRLLINEININHESQIPESLTRNVVLIKELNCNIKKVVELYSGLPSSFIRSLSSSDESQHIPPFSESQQNH